MSATNLTGNDTLVLNNRVLKDFTDQTVIDLSSPNKVAAVKVGKNRNAIFAENAMGYSCDLKLRLLRRGVDDGFLLALYNLQTGGNFAQTILLQGSFVKQIGDGAGNLKYDSYVLQGGIFVSPQSGISSPEGNTEQNSVLYEIVFANVFRAAD